MSTYAPVVAVVIPALSAVICALSARRRHPVGPVLAVLASASSLAVGVWALGAGAGFQRAASSGSLPWFGFGHRVLEVGWAIDGLSAMMLCVVGIVAGAVSVYSSAYLGEDPGRGRYFAVLSLFIAAMGLLIIADGYLGLFIGWELVGTCSYLLIGYWFDRPSAADASVKAFLTTRAGDAAFILGLGVLWSACGTLSFAGVAGAVETMDGGTAALAAALIAAGAIGKSAQFPLQAWLPDAMEGPTPVSALIHAATMVAAGVFLIARSEPLFDAAREAAWILVTAGVVSAVGAALAACVQVDIKRVLAYSTISQLGFMFVALGVGAYGAAMFHLLTHAAFKALLFLGAGSVIHAFQTQDIRLMGGAAWRMRVTTVTWLVGAAALAGLPPLSGFFSKDEVLTATQGAAPALALLLLVTAAVTAFYVTRLTVLVFWGPVPTDRHPHESPPAMWIPLAVLSIPSAVLGAAAPWVGGMAGEPAPHAAAWLPYLAAAVSVGGVLAGWIVYRHRPALSADRPAPGPLTDLLRAGWRWDAVIDRVVVRPVVNASSLLFRLVDRALLDGAAEGVARMAQSGGRLVSLLQSGDGQAYAAVVWVGALLFAVVAVVTFR